MHEPGQPAQPGPEIASEGFAELATEALLETFPQGVLIGGMLGGVIFANRQARELLGLGGAGGSELRRPIVMPDWEPTDREGRVYTWKTFPWMPTDGSPPAPLELLRWEGGRCIQALALWRQRWSTRAGQYAQVVTVIADITDRVLQQECLRDQEELARRLFRDSPCLQALSTLEEGRFVDVNDAFLTTFGYGTRDEVIGRTSQELLTWEDLRQRQHVKSTVLRDGQILNFEATFLTRDQRRRTGLFSARLLDVKGQKLLLSTMDDITDRRQEEETARVLLDAPRDLVLMVDARCQILAANAAAQERLGGVTLQGRGLLELIPEPTRPLLFSRLSEAQSSPQPVSLELNLDKSVYDVTVYPVRCGQARVERLVVWMHEITSLRRMEARLAYLASHDGMTDAMNRGYFEEQVRQLEQEPELVVGVLVCDIDGLKLVNDTLGHVAGDQLMVSVAEVLRQTFREGDLVARTGGDEFAVLLRQTTEAALEQAQKRLQEALARYREERPELPLSVSVGAAVARGGRITEALAEADARMYRMKYAHRGDMRRLVLETYSRHFVRRQAALHRDMKGTLQLARVLGEAAGLREEALRELELLAEFHDLGEVGVEEHILAKQGPLNADERVAVNRHPEIGHRIALSTQGLQSIADQILKHHEWWNGEGYPLGLSGEDIPLPCRILSLVAAWQAMVSDRPYRARLSPEAALRELEGKAGSQFDPKLVMLLAQLVRLQTARDGGTEQPPSPAKGGSRSGF